jgi:hypothetical protein
MMRRIALVMAFALAASAACAHGEAPKSEAAHAAPNTKPGPGATKASLPVDPMSLIEISEDAWSVSKTEAGCYLMSPRRKGSSRLAIGRHPTLGLALFAVDFPMATQIADGREKLVLRVAGEDMTRVARPAGKNLLVGTLDPADVEAALTELQENGTLWLELRQTWVTHGGRKLPEAIAQYRHDCASDKAS